MTKQAIIELTLKAMSQLPDKKAEEISDLFVSAGSLGEDPALLGQGYSIFLLQKVPDTLLSVLFRGVPYGPGYPLILHAP